MHGHLNVELRCLYSASRKTRFCFFKFLSARYPNYRFESISFFLFSPPSLMPMIAGMIRTGEMGILGGSPVPLYMLCPPTDLTWTGRGLSTAQYLESSSFLIVNMLHVYDQDQPVSAGNNPCLLRE